MEPWQSWAAFLGLAAFTIYYYTRNSAGKARGRPTQRVNEAVTRVKDDVMNKSAGGSIPKAAGKAAKTKSQRKANKKPAGEVVEEAAAQTSAHSSTTGGGGDDDVSPPVSPTRNTTATRGPSGRDVSDMLAPKAAAASVLRLTEPTQPVRQKQAHQPRAAAPQETKKQRQNKKKVEEKKLQREQEEKERQRLLEKQRRTAREARGEPAKNGLQQAKAPSSNAWNLSNGTSNTAVDTIAGSNHGPLLDTFDQDEVSITSSSEGATAGTSATTEDVANDNAWANGMTEEEQVRLAMADSEWTTVPKGRKGKKLKATSTDGSEAGTPLEQSIPKPAPTPSAAPTPKAEYSTSAEAAAHYTSNHPMDSDWPVV